MSCVQHTEMPGLPGLHVLSAAFLELCVCIAQVAGQSSGVNVVDKAQSAVNTVKIINALNEISDILKVPFSAILLLQTQSPQHPAETYPALSSAHSYASVLSTGPYYAPTGLILSPGRDSSGCCHKSEPTLEQN